MKGEPVMHSNPRPNFHFWSKEQLARSRDYLIAARELVAKGWTRQAYARRADGETTVPGDQSAVCFCSMGAMYRARGLRLALPLDGFADFQALKHAAGHIVEMNDTAESVDEVLACFDEAIGMITEAIQ